MSEEKQNNNQISMDIGGIGSPSIDDNNIFLNEEELKKVLASESTFYQNFVEKYWLQRYHLMKITAETVHVPSITSTVSDMPSSNSGVVESKVENYALKSVTAKEWIDQLHSSIKLLPESYQQIIDYKYLQRRYDGTAYSDRYIYSEMNISRDDWYKMKPKALEELGRILFSLHQ